MSASPARIISAIRTIQALAPKERNLAIWLIDGGFDAPQYQSKPKKAKRAKPARKAAARRFRCNVCHRMLDSRQGLGTHTTRMHSQRSAEAEASA